MPGLEQLIDQLKAAGMTIEGEEALAAAKTAAAPSWIKEVARLALAGRKEGIRFIRTSMEHPSTMQIAAIVRGFPFTTAEQLQIIQNIVPA